MGDFFGHFWLGIRTYWDAVLFIRDNRLYHYFFFPAILFALLWWGASSLQNYLDHVSLREVSTIGELRGELIRFFFLSLVALSGFKLRKYIIFFLLSPLLTQLSLKTELLITGNQYPSDWKQFWKDIKRALRIATGNFLLEYSIFALWFIFYLFLPDMEPITPFFLFGVGCYFYGFSMMDYVNERRRLSINKSVTFVREHAGFAIGNGFIFSLMFIIPYDIGVILAPVLAVVAGTIGMHELVDLNKNPYANK
jgi:CysZ protein